MKIPTLPATMRHGRGLIAPFAVLILVVLAHAALSVVVAARWHWMIWIIIPILLIMLGKLVLTLARHRARD